eukprot:UN02629
MNPNKMINPTKITITSAQSTPPLTLLKSKSKTNTPQSGPIYFRPICGGESHTQVP